MTILCSHQDQGTAQMWSSQDTDEFPYQPFECYQSSKSFRSDLMPVSGLKITKAPFASMKLLSILKSGTHRADRREVAVCAWSAAQSYKPCGCQINTGLQSDLTLQQKLSSSAFCVIIPGTSSEPEEVWGRRLLPSPALCKNSSSAYKYSDQNLHQRDTHFHSPVSFMIRDWIKENTYLHIPMFLFIPFLEVRKDYIFRFSLYALTQREIHLTFFVNLRTSILLKGENNFYFKLIFEIKEAP